MNIINERDIILHQDYCCECKGNDDVKTIEINNNMLTLCKKCRLKLADMLKRTIKETE